MQTIISASILSADFANLGHEVKAVIAAGADVIHFDVMDHHFVPNLSFGPLVCQALRKAGIKAPIDVHLMVTDPNAYIESFAKAGANLITFHPETVEDVGQTLALIRQHSMQTGLALNPETPLDQASPYLAELDLLLLMSVHPGFAGQKFIPQSLPKLAAARELIAEVNKKVHLGIDGGIKLNTITAAAEHGADFFIVGSGIFSADDYVERITALRKAILPE